MPANCHSSAESTPVGSDGGAHGRIGTPSAWVARWIGLLEAGGRALDLACGQGRHVGPLLAQGLSVLAVDRDPQALAAVDPRAERRLLDLEGAPWRLAPASFDAVVVCNYLFRPRLDLLAGLLAPGGVLLYETFARGNEQFGKPANPDFLLRSGELLQVAGRAGLAVLAYEHGFVEAPKPALVQRLCAVRAPLSGDRFRLRGPVG